MSPMTHAFFRNLKNISIMETYFVQGMVKVWKYGMSEGMNAESSIWAGCYITVGTFTQLGLGSLSKYTELSLF